MAVLHTDLRETHRIGGRTRELIVAPAACPPLAARGIALCGLSWARPPFAFHRPRPDMRQVLLCVAGRGRATIQGEWRGLVSGHGYLTPPRVEHAYEACAGGAWELCWVTYRSDVADAVVLDAPTQVTVDPRGLWAAIHGLYLEAQGVAAAPVLAGWAELVDLHARRACAAASPSAPAPRLVRLWEAVDADLARPWTLGDLARMAEVGDEQLRRLSLREVGRPPLAQVAWLRMRRAASLLNVHGPSIAAVAEAVGYQDPFAFSTAFKRAHGVPPSAMRDGRGR